MKLGLRLFLGFFIIVGLTAWFGLQWVQHELRPVVSQTSEESLVETANLLAAIVEPSITQHGKLDPVIEKQLHQYITKPIKAYIWQRTKNNLNLSIYITNKNGIVIFDSLNEHAGSDFSKWNDVYLTLRGEYGVRSTRTDPQDEFTSVMYVSAPIKHEGEIIGALTVSLPNNSTQPYIELSEKRLYLYGGLLILLSSLIGIGFTAWLIISLRKISRYAEAVSQNNNPSIPHFSKGTELEHLTQALDRMRTELEGKKYVEQYVHTLTHELKSPLAAIRATNELLNDTTMVAEQRTQFTKTVEDQCLRLQQLIERLLDLVKLEQRRYLQRTESINLFILIENILFSYQTRTLSKNIVFYIDGDNKVSVTGERFLIEQAITNLLDNALAFADHNSTITIRVRDELASNTVSMDIENVGTLIPDYALPRLSERFYSLPRPDGGKGFGLGLNFVNQIMELHNGYLTINNTEEGVCTTLTFKKV